MSRRPTLQQGLDRDIYQIVRSLDEQRVEEGGKRLTISAVYDSIKHSNSSLKRRSKKLLEDSIDRVLRVLDDERDDSESIDGTFDGIEEPVPIILKDSNLMNRNIRKNLGTPASGTMTPKDATTPGPAVPSLDNAFPESPSKLEKHERQTNGEPKLKRRKAEREGKKEEERLPPKLADISFASLGGVDDVVEQLEEIAMVFIHPDTYLNTGDEPPRGVLLHGPPGCGKTMIANAFAAELGVSYIPLSAPTLVAGMSGESEKKVREIFDEAKRMAPCLVFIDEIDVIMGKRESAQREMEKRIVAQMLTCMDDMALEKTDGKPVMIFAATNRPDSLDPALRRAGRFNKEINLGVPNEQAREKILRTLTRKSKSQNLQEGFDFRSLAKLTAGFVGADLKDLVSVTGDEARKRRIAVLKQLNKAEDMDVDEVSPAIDTITPALKSFRALVATAGKPLPEGDFFITYADFLTALPKVQPSAKREGFATIPDTTWAHIGALQRVREELEMAIVHPIRDPESFAQVGITAPTGVLLWGPPGCGKTLLAKAVANESKANFISIKGPELLNKYVGESERAVRQVFERARSSVPCILFFDELDALVPKREDSLSEASSKVVNTLLTEMDGLSNRAGIYVVAATNRPDMIDPAMLRPGRLTSKVFVDLPTAEERIEILKTLYKINLPDATEEEISHLEVVARNASCTDFSGADLDNLRVEAGRVALKRKMLEKLDIVRITETDWIAALGLVKKSVHDIARYRRLRDRGM